MPPDQQDAPQTDIPVHVLDAKPTPYDGRGRWLLRAANLRGRNFYAARFREYREMRKLLQSLQPSAVLCYYGEISLRTVDVASSLGIPTIAYIHGDVGLKQNRWYRWSLIHMLQRFAEIVVVSEQERTWLLSVGAGADRVHVIPCGAPTGQFSPVTERSPGPVRFAMVSRLVEQKGCRQSVSAFAEVASKRPEVALEIFGDGPLRDELERLVQAHQVADRVTFHGDVDNAVLAQELPRCDVFLQHSLIGEGASVSIVEAMASGLPVVTTALGGNVDLVLDGVTGFTVGEGDTAAMARAMLQLTDDEALRVDMSRRARVRAVESFDAAVLARRLEQVVLTVSDTTGRHRSAGKPLTAFGAAT
jgi:glycosyltransferase involved in cell wall biosynthesis